MDADAGRGEARRRARNATRSCCRSTSSSRCSRSRCSRTSRCCATTDAGATSAAPASGARSLLRRHVPAAASRRRWPNAEISNVWNEFGRGHFAFYISGPWNIGEFQRRLPADRQQSWMTAPLPGPDGPGRVDRRRLEPRALPRVAPQGGGVAADRIPVAARRAAALPRAHRRPAAAAQRLGRSAQLADDVYARAFRDQLERVKPTPKVPEWERIATEMRLVAERLVHGELDGGRRRPPSSTRAPTGSSRSAAGCSRAGTRRGEEAPAAAVVVRRAGARSSSACSSSCRCSPRWC